MIAYFEFRFISYQYQIPIGKEGEYLRPHPSPFKGLLWRVLLDLYFLLKKIYSGFGRHYLIYRPINLSGYRGNILMSHD